MRRLWRLWRRGTTREERETANAVEQFLESGLREEKSRSTFPFVSLTDWEVFLLSIRSCCRHKSLHPSHSSFSRNWWGKEKREKKEEGEGVVPSSSSTSSSTTSEIIARSQGSCTVCSLPSCTSCDHRLRFQSHFTYITSNLHQIEKEESLVKHTLSEQGNEKTWPSTWLPCNWILGLLRLLFHFFSLLVYCNVCVRLSLSRWLTLWVSIPRAGVRVLSYDLQFFLLRHSCQVVPNLNYVAHILHQLSHLWSWDTTRVCSSLSNGNFYQVYDYDKARESMERIFKEFPVQIREKLQKLLKLQAVKETSQEEHQIKMMSEIE